jgi:hypothetical protein
MLASVIAMAIAALLQQAGSDVRITALYLRQRTTGRDAHVGSGGPRRDIAPDLNLPPKTPSAKVCTNRIV